MVDLAVVVGAVGVAACVLPVGLARSRSIARESVCADHAAALQAALVAQASAKGTFSLSFAYAANQTGLQWRIEDQQFTQPNSENGNIHFSAFLAAEGYTTGDEIYTCPVALRGGAPRTNPGSNPAHWEPGQINDLGINVPGPSPTDRQAPRMAYTTNGAIIPRNLVSPFFSGNQRRNMVARLPDPRADEVSTFQPANPANTILLTEFAFSPTAGWASVRTVEGISKSHRPITPFLGVSAGTNVYNEPNLPTTTPRFRYPSVADIIPAAQIGGNLWGTNTELNAVGRHHEGGTAHFAFLDGSVRQDTVQNTIASRQWGERFWGISGNQAVMP